MNSRKRILVIKLSSFGDLFHALPAVNNLKVVLDADVDWVTQPEYVELVGCFPFVSNVISFPRRKFWSQAGTLYRAIRACRYEYIIDLQGLLKSAIVSRLARGGIRIGPSFHREGARFFYDVVAGPRNKERHAVDENLDVVRYLGLPVLPVSFPVMFPAADVPGPAPRVAIVPISRRANKNWPVERFMETARALRNDCGASLYFFGSASDREVCEQMRAELMKERPESVVVNMAGRTSLVEMGGWFTRMNLVVVNDSGPLHMATALGIPVVTMFGPTDPRRTGPYGQQQRVITTKMACRPCFDKVCPMPRPDCMTRISSEPVITAAKAILAGLS